MAESTVVIVLTTLGVDADAAAFARTLIDEQLAACVSVLPPITSVYRWKGEVGTAAEQQLLIKTAVEKLAPLQERFHTLHPYELPEFLVVQPVEVSRLYGAWVKESVETG
jgi:periplasmic divalent cation tolerance protein